VNDGFVKRNVFDCQVWLKSLVLFCNAKFHPSLLK
jgi:hypothetical protein